MVSAVAPSTCSCIFEHETYLSFPAIAGTGDRLAVIFRTATGNPLDYNSRILMTESEDGGRTWAEPSVWVDVPDCDSRNCGGGTLSDGTIHFVYDLHNPAGRRWPFVRWLTDDRAWSAPLHLNADTPGAGENQVTTVSNRGIEWDREQMYFPCFRGQSVLLHRKDHTQVQMPMVPRVEPAIAFNRRGELVAFSKGGGVDISYDRGQTWVAEGDVETISQPDLIQLSDGRLLFCYSGEERLDEWLLLSEDGHNVYHEHPLKIFEGTPDGALKSRGKAMCVEYGDEILTVLYEACGPRGNSRIFLVRTPKDALEIT